MGERVLSHCAPSTHPVLQSRWRGLPAMGISSISVGSGLSITELAYCCRAIEARLRAHGSLAGLGPIDRPRMMIDRVVSQVRVRHLETALQFYEAGLGGNRLFVYEDFYAGIALGQSEIHLKCIEDVDPGIAYVQQSEHVTLYCWTPSLAGALRQLLTASHQGSIVRDAHDTPWGTREAILEDPDGHRIYLAEKVTA